MEFEIPNKEGTCVTCGTTYFFFPGEKSHVVNSVCCYCRTGASLDACFGTTRVSPEVWCRVEEPEDDGA